MAGVTIRDLAKQLGVSTATISMALNNRPGISPETRQRVQEAVRESGYNLDRLTGTPGKKRGNMELVIYKKTGRVVGDTPFFSSLIESIEQEAAAAGYQLGIRYMGPDTPLTGLAGGVILLATEMDETDLEPFLSLGLPLVALDNSFQGSDVNSVAIDNAGGTGRATMHLISLGHERIGYLASSDRIRNFEERFSGYQNALARAGLEPAEVISLPANMDGARQGMQNRLADHSVSCTAFVADNDLIAMGAMMELRERCVIGRDLSVIGFDDLPFSRICDPQLSTLRVYHDALGRTAVRRLLELQREPDQPVTHTLVGVGLKLRGSVGNGPEA